jgi:hypothetical protein
MKQRTQAYFPLIIGKHLQYEIMYTVKETSNCKNMFGLKITR